MSAQGNGRSGSFRVIMSAQNKAILKRHHEEAMENGTGQSFVAAFRQIVQRLSRDPQIFGEPLYRLAAMQLSVRQAAVLPLVVDYAVHEQRFLVFIRGFKVMS